MRLNKLKLAGFKSFVEPTTLSFPSDKVGIVGPNGCGKSNIIDAVRWVMGESSAKQLRGAAMSDVIFNGSRTRKPIDQASIELVFGSVNVPQYPPNSEIAVKRQLSRNGQSVYFLNSVRCRRKDITDLFLGTGLGPRSYAIIEQGMISRLIEAKPDDLRIFLEEAAGISKYKERRKETEHKMHQTRDNLARLDEVRHELEKQLKKLKKQAKQAEQYQELTKLGHLQQAQLQAIHWYTLDTAVQKQQQYIDEQAAHLDTDLQSLHNFDTTHKKQRETQSVAQNTLHDIQASFYDIEGDISRLEQEKQHVTERRTQLQADLKQLDITIDESQTTLKSDEQQLVYLKTDLQESETDLHAIVEIETETLHSFRETEAQVQEWQYTYDAFNQRAAEPTQRAQVKRAHIENIEHRLEQNKQRLCRLEDEKKDIDIKTLMQIMHDLDNNRQNTHILLEAEKITLNTHQERVLTLRSLTQEYATQLHQHQLEEHTLNGRLSALETLQEVALGTHEKDKNAWLQTQGISDNPRLAQALQVDSGWEHAVECVLGEKLQALCVEDMAELQTALVHPPKGNLAVFEPNTSSTVSTHTHATLLDKIQAPWPLTTLFVGISIARTLTEAYHMRQQLSAEESVITPEGVWLGSNWLLSQQDSSEQSGVLARVQEISDLITQLSHLKETIQNVSQTLEQQQSTLTKQEALREQAQLKVNDILQELSQLESQYAGKQARLELIQIQKERIVTESGEITAQISQDKQELQTSSDQLHAALEEMGQLADEREALTKQHNLYKELVHQANEAWQTAKDDRHKIDIRLESLRTHQTRVLQSITRLQKQFKQLIMQSTELKRNLEDNPISALQNELEEKQGKYHIIKESLIQATQTVEHLEHALNDYDGERARLEIRCNELRADLEKARLECQANEVRRQTFEDALAKTEFSPIALLGDLPEDANDEQWEAHIESTDKKLKRLGSVNLAALEEYEEQAERQHYFDNQADDLNKALNSLDNAIKTIDRETRARFQQTIDKVNTFLQDMFPRLFGGGEASLQLTGSDVLKSGVTIMARPPGKRNTHIHLLSGGEKALTAIALVFAIFELNPAPFCMLDEVDAPLDDSNVGRFCTLVKAMSKRVQFIFISHNKITMEIAEQLIGVTMQEAGVSRLVAVDVDMAVEMIKA